jgi:predicted secreted protein
MGGVALSLPVAVVLAAGFALFVTATNSHRPAHWLPNTAPVRFVAVGLAALAPALMAAELTCAIIGQPTLFGRSLGGAIAVYFVIWWTVLFAILPFGVQSQLEAGEAVAGSDPGAPAQPLLKKKALLTTAAATVVFTTVWMLIIRNALGIDAFDFLPR